MVDEGETTISKREVMNIQTRLLLKGICRNSGTWGSPDAVKVDRPHVGPPTRHSRSRHKTGRCPPHLPHGIQMDTASTTKAKDWETLRSPLNPEEDMEVPRTPTPGRRPGSPPGTNLHTREEDEPASSDWKLPEDLGAKKMEAPRRKAVSLCPPSLEKVGDRA